MMKKSALVFIRMALMLSIVLTGTARQAWAQIDYPIGTEDLYNNANASSWFLPAYPCPIQDFSEGARSQYLYLASELTAAGMQPGAISAIKFKSISANGAGVTENLVVKLGGTANTSLQYDTWEALTGTVTNTIGNYQAVTGMNTLTLATPFIWNGTDNIVVEVCNGDPASASSTVTTNTVNASFYLSYLWDATYSHTYYGNNLSGGTACGVADAADMGNGSYRPTITFTWEPATTCDGTFDAGNTLASATTVCGGESFKLSWSGALAKGMTYQWQQSANNSTWTNIAPATGFTYTTQQTTSTWYRLQITCSNGGSVKYANSVQINSPALLEGTFTINNALAASDIAAGQFKTFTEAFNYIKCGIKGPVVFNVVNNSTPYNEQVVIPAIAGTSTVNTITINGNNATITANSTDDAQRAVIKLNGADHININNLTIKATGSSYSEYGYGIHLLNNADSNTVKGCTISVSYAVASSNYAGIVVNGENSYVGGTTNGLCDGNLFENNTIDGGYYGVAFVGDESAPINYNKLINNKITNFYYYGVYLTGSNYTQVNSNDISRPGIATSSSSVYGIALDQVNMLIAISGNRIHNFFAQQSTTTTDFYGISFSNVDTDPGVENVVSNNLIYDVVSNGSIYAIRNFGSNSAQYYYNTIALTDASSTSLKPAYGFYLDFAASNIDIKNNIVVIARGGAGMKYGVYMADENIALYTFDYNDYFLADHPTTRMGYFGGAVVNTLADWRTATTQDAHSVNEEPGFTDAANGNFTPTSAVIADKGTPVSIVKDINNANRSSTKPDMGAYEYALPTCTAGSNPGNAFSNLGTVTCPDKNMVLNLKGNDVGLGLTYTWESAVTTTGTWTSISQPLQYPAYTVKTSATTLYYRAAVSCNGGTAVYSVPVQVTVGGYFPAGTYTIDASKPSDPSGTKNFHSFADAVAAINCGIAGPVVFNVTTGTYNEQFRLNQINGTSKTNTITFQSATGNAADAILQYSPTGANDNYVVMLDSATNVNFKNITFSNTADEANGRMLSLMNTAGEDSIIGCRFQGPDVSSIITYLDPVGSAGIYGLNLKGSNLVINNNTFTKASRSIYLAGVSATEFTRNHTITGNTFDSAFHQTVYIANASGIKVNNNTVHINSPLSGYYSSAAVSGIYLSNCDSAIQVNGNTVTAQDNPGWVNGILVTNSDATNTARGQIKNNKVTAVDNLGSYINGIYVSYGAYLDIINNESSVASAVDGTINYEYAAALFTSNNKNTNIYNNSLLNTSPQPGMYNAAMYIDHSYFSEGGLTNIFNNIMANKGGGPAAVYMYTAEMVKVDYNLLYTSGANLVQRGPDGGSYQKSYATIDDWRKAYSTDLNSIVYNPAFTSTTDLRPLASDAGSWALQGRGTQITGNNADKNGNTRSVTLTDGVPDLGAYEFFPSVAPPALTATPATPAAGTTQRFMMGSDTVTTIQWDAAAAVPSSLTLKRYSGVLPDGLAATEKSLYYYVEASATGSGSYKMNMKQYFIDPWLRTLPIKSFIKLGKTNAAGVWTASGTATIDSIYNVITDTATYLGKFTGLTDSKSVAPPVYTTTNDSTNKGTRFWAPYGLNREALVGNGQQFKLRLAADVASQVTVSVIGTRYSKTYSVAAGAVVTTDEIPKSGANDACLRDEGLYNRGILIESDHPIAASVFVDVVDYTSSLLLPTGTYGKSYTILGARQISGYGDPVMGTSWANVIADHDNTVVEITPAAPTSGGRKAGEPFRVTLQRGQVYQLLGAFKERHKLSDPNGDPYGYECYELTGTTIVSVPNNNGECYPIAAFSGSSGTGIRCEGFANGADKYMFAQSYPNQAWGRYYLTAPLATRNSKNEMLFNVFRVMVKDASTVVKRNGVAMTGINGNIYQFTSRDPEYIEADKPVMVAQFMTYFTACGNDEYSNPGSNENMFYLTPLGHGIKSTSFYRNSGSISYVTAIVPTVGLSSLKIGGSNTFDSTYTHPQNPAYSVAMKKFASANAVSSITCDTTFTANVHLPYNFGVSYNVGYQIPRVDFDSTVLKNVYNVSGNNNTYTCVKTPVRVSVLLPVTVSTLTWQLSQTTGVTPNTDVTQTALVALDTVEIDHKDFYVYTLNQDLSFAATGTYTIPVKATYQETQGSCPTEITGALQVVVTDAPTVDYTIDYTGCVNATASFTPVAAASNGAVIDRWNWNFGDNTSSTIEKPTKQWSNSGTYPVILQVVANDGCVNNTSKDIVVHALPTVAVVADSLSACAGSNVTFQVKDAVTGVTYNWFATETGTTTLANGTTYTATVNGTQLYYLGATQNGCASDNRVEVTAYIKPDVSAPVVSVDSIGVYAIRFAWDAVPGATGYVVSTDGGLTWNVPSAGSTGTTHIVTGLQPNQSVTLLVKSIGGCIENTSAPVTGTTLSDKVFVPNSFSPNGDGKNDVLMVYGASIKQLKFMVFNQWGQKVFETSDTGRGWDGSFSGKPQPSGVYMFVCTATLINGQEISKKGSINLIR